MLTRPEATVFGYFELLVKAGDLSLVDVEELRIKSFEEIMKMAGVDYDLLVDMFDNTWELFDAIKKAMQNSQDAEAVLMNILNDESISESIVYHFKVGSLVTLRNTY
jgi:thymidylate synthase ThyX